MLPQGFLDRPVAHRALHDAAEGRIENSRGAVAAAVAAGYGIEIDAQRSADGRAMVFHDHALGRLTGETGPVHRMDSATLQQVTLTDSTETIPTLAEILALVAGRVPLIIEIKDQDGALGPDIGALEAAVAADLAGYAGPVAVMSFNPHSMAAMARLCPDVPRGLTAQRFDRSEWGHVPEARRTALTDLADFEPVGASFVSQHWRDLDAPAIDRLKASGVPILCWTIRSAAEAASARQAADQITFEGFAA